LRSQTSGLNARRCFLLVIFLPGDRPFFSLGFFSEMSVGIARQHALLFSHLRRSFCPPIKRAARLAHQKRGSNQTLPVHPWSKRRRGAYAATRFSAEDLSVLPS